MVRRAYNRRDRRTQENAGPKNKRARRRTSDQDEETYSEDEECEEVMLGEKSKKTNGEMHAPPTVKQEEEAADQNRPAGAENGMELTNGVKVDDNNEQNKKRYPMNGDVKKEPGCDASGTKPYTDSSKPAELPMHKEQLSDSMTAPDSCGDVEQKPNIQSESAQPAEAAPPPQPAKRKC